jgi:hypothetical protein
MPRKKAEPQGATVATAIVAKLAVPCKALNRRAASVDAAMPTWRSAIPGARADARAALWSALVNIAVFCEAVGCGGKNGFFLPLPVHCRPATFRAFRAPQSPDGRQAPETRLGTPPS